MRSTPHVAGHRPLLLAVALAASLLLSSCGAMFQSTVPRGEVASSHFASARGEKILGYTTTDGEYHKVLDRPKARLEGDTLVFRSMAPDWPWDMNTHRVPIAELQSVRGEYVPVTYYVVVGVLGLGVAVGLAVAALSQIGGSVE